MQSRKLELHSEIVASVFPGCIHFYLIKKVIQSIRDENRKTGHIFLFMLLVATLVHDCLEALIRQRKICNIKYLREFEGLRVLMQKPHLLSFNVPKMQKRKDTSLTSTKDYQKRLSNVCFWEGDCCGPKSSLIPHKMYVRFSKLKIEQKGS